MDLGSESSGKGCHKTSNNNESSNNGRRQLVSRRIVLEDEGEDINTMADAFIRNFRKQLKLDKEASFKRFQEMINRSA